MVNLSLAILLALTYFLNTAAHPYLFLPDYAIVDALNLFPAPFHDNNELNLPDGTNKQFSISELREDFDELRMSLENTHCCLYEYTPRASFDSLFDHQYQLLNTPMGYDAFFNILSPLLTSVGCMHTGLWMPGSFWNSGSGKLFPLQLKLIENNAVVSGYYNDTAQAPRGSIIIEVNGIPIREIIKEIKNSIPADGMNGQFKSAGFEKRFSLQFASIYGLPDRYIVTYALPGGKAIITDEIIPADYQSVKKIVFKNFNHPPLTLNILENKTTAVMKIPSFIYYDRVEYFKHFLDSSFLEIRNKSIKNLILDLRGNDGGDPFCAVPLLSYLEKKPVRYFAEEYGKYSEFAKPVPVAENNFTGNLYTLIDKHIGSTTGHFCAVLKYNKIGKFAGSEGGSTYKCNAKVKEFSLKNTGIIINIARQTFAAAVNGMDKTRGVLPDFPVEQTYRDFLDGNDSVMKYILNIISERSIE